MDGTPDPEPFVNGRAGRPVGVIYGNVGSVDFSFAVTGPARKLDYVQVHHQEHGWLLGQIVDLFRETRLSYDGASLLFAEENGKEVRGRLSARVHLFGFRDDQGHMEAPLTPLNAGQTVYRAEDGFIGVALGLGALSRNGGRKGDEGGVEGRERSRDGPPGVYIGRLKGHGTRVRLDPNVLIQRHASVIAKTGGGKSYMAGILVEGLLELGVPTVILDPHGEYPSLAHPNTDPGDLARMHDFGVRPAGFPRGVAEYAVDQELNVGALPLRFSESGMDAVTMLELAGLRGSGPQLALLAGVVDMLKGQGGEYGFEDVIELLEMDRAGARWNVINALIRLRNSGLFSGMPTRPGDLVRAGRCTIINMRGLGPDIANIAASLVVRNLFSSRKRGGVPPFMLILEEAHMFCPQGGHTPARDIIRTVAAEGRKFGMGLGVITQRPAKVDKNVLSQCHTQMILKVTNPNDLRSVTAAAEGLTTRMSDEIQRLPVGVALVVGGSLAAPVLVEVRPRRTKHGGREIDVLGGTVPGAMEMLAVEATPEQDGQWEGGQDTPVPGPREGPGTFAAGVQGLHGGPASSGREHRPVDPDPVDETARRIGDELWEAIKEATGRGTRDERVGPSDKPGLAADGAPRRNAGSGDPEGVGPDSGDPEGVGPGSGDPEGVGPDRSDLSRDPDRTRVPGGPGRTGRIPWLARR